MSLACRFDQNPCHATAVALDGAGLLICGASGAGKSALALDLISRGAALIADDRVCLTLQGADLMVSSPNAIRNKIEARGIGLLHCPATASAPLRLVVDLDRGEPARLPQSRSIVIQGHHFPLILGAGLAHLAPSIMLALRYGRAEP